MTVKPNTLPSTRFCEIKENSTSCLATLKKSIKSPFFKSNLDSMNSNRMTVQETGELSNLKGRSKNEEKAYRKHVTGGKNGKEYLTPFKARELSDNHQARTDRDLQRFKAKYNASMGNIARSWLSLVYCILILRMNLIKFVLNNIPDKAPTDDYLQKQILLESRIILNMIRGAQNSSQEKFYFLWTQLEKLIVNRKVFQTAMELLQSKDTAYRDWKSADARLAEIQLEYFKSQEEYKSIERNKIDLENATKETVMRLEKLSQWKDDEYKTLLEEIADMKKREVQTRGRILINMKIYKDLKAKKEKLIKVEESMQKLKSEQTVLAGEYSTKIKILKGKIEEHDKEIKEEIEEKKKIKESLEAFGDYSETKISEEH